MKKHEAKIWKKMARQWGRNIREGTADSKTDQKDVILTPDSNAWAWTCTFRQEEDTKPWNPSPHSPGTWGDNVVEWTRLWHQTNPGLDPSLVTRQLCVWVPLRLFLILCLEPLWQWEDAEEKIGSQQVRPVPKFMSFYWVWFTRREAKGESSSERQKTLKEMENGPGPPTWFHAQHPDASHSAAAHHITLLPHVLSHPTPLKFLSMFCTCYTFMVTCLHTGPCLVCTTWDSLSPEQEVGLTSQPKSYYSHYGKWLLKWGHKIWGTASLSLLWENLVNTS